MIGISTTSKPKNMTKTKFLYTYHKYPPSPFVEFMYEHFNTDLPKRPIGTILALSSGSLGTIGMIVSSELDLLLLSRISLGFVLGFFTLLVTLPAFILNNIRIKKIVEELGITPDQYNVYVKMFVK